MARFSQMHVTNLIRQTGSASMLHSSFKSHVNAMCGQTSLAECQFSDKHLAGALEKIDKGVAELMQKYPGRKRPQIKSGLRGPKYYIELGIAGKNVDAFSLILSTEKLLKDGKKDQGVKITDTDSFSAGENVSYKIDYSVDSSTVGGGKSKGTVFIRGVKSETGFDSFKLVVEKMVDFAKLDSDLIINAVEHFLKM
mmetsp:Transcript_41786/g.55068  ORF Transcript_41786/g.55068 Transcript_41786/m.55068 type:complete len:196 (-) Transcript_41786:1088-1675(-)